MNGRPINSRLRPTHSIAGAFAVGFTIAAFAIVILLIAGGARP